MTLTDTFFTDKIDDNVVQAFYQDHCIVRTDSKTSLGKSKQGGTLIAIPSFLTLSNHETYYNCFTQVSEVSVKEFTKFSSLPFEINPPQH